MTVRSGLSKELQIGKAGEYLVCADLIMQGHNAFLSDQGLPFDIVIERNGRLKTIQVKSTGKFATYGKSRDVYRFGLRVGRGGKRVPDEVACDYYAFVALDIRTVAYVKAKDMMSSSGKLKMCMDFKSKDITYLRKPRTNGRISENSYGKYIQDYGKFKF